MKRKIFLGLVLLLSIFIIFPESTLAKLSCVSRNPDTNACEAPRAASCPNSTMCCTDIGMCPASISGLQEIFVRIVGYALGFAGVVLFVLLIVGGFKFITSGGDPKAVEGAKKTLTSAIAGLFIILAAYLILVLIKNVTGVDVTRFNILLPQ